MSRYWIGKSYLKAILGLLSSLDQFKQGHRIRIALAGANKNHFQNLDGPAPTWEVWHISDRPSHIELPVVR